MILMVDAGNTNISIGIALEDGSVVSNFRLTTDLVRTEDEISAQICQILSLRNIKKEEITGAIISSVVPKLNSCLQEAINETFNINPVMVRYDMNSGMDILFEEKSSLGADRLVDAVAAYDKVKGAVLVIDFGTATTFDLVNADGNFVTGVTSPGLESMANSLWAKAAKLPEVELVKPKSILANNTIESMQAGIMYGYIGLTEYTIKQLKKEVPYDFKIIATGGLGKLICKETDLIDEYDPNLAYRGMKILWEKNK